MEQTAEIEETNQIAMKRVEKRDEGDENDLFSNLPMDLKTEILVRLPAKSLVKFICVSKFWSSIIHSKGLTELYLARSSTRPRLLLTFAREEMRFFHSYSQEDPSSDQISITPDLGWIHDISPPVRGLICYRNGTKMLIRNPSTDQFLTLPKVKTRRRNIYHVFGYDPVNDLYKVLCMVMSRRAKLAEHQVFTLGAKQRWRKIKCEHPHDYFHPFKGLCLNGAVYYIALIGYRRFLISFDLSSEGFHVTKFPQDVKHDLPCYELVNYNGKIALTITSCNGTLDLWVLEDASKQGWSKISVLVPSWSDLVGNRFFVFKGAINTGELIFAPCRPFTPFFFLYYDLKENISKKVAIKGTGAVNCVTEVFLDHVESPMILPKVS